MKVCNRKYGNFAYKYWCVLLNIRVFYFEAGFVFVSIVCIINYNLRSSSGNSHNRLRERQFQSEENKELSKVSFRPYYHTNNKIIISELRLITVFYSHCYSLGAFKQIWQNFNLNLQLNWIVLHLICFPMGSPPTKRTYLGCNAI